MDKHNACASDEVLSSFKRNRRLTPATAWMTFQDKMLSEMSQSQKDNYFSHLLEEALYENSAARLADRQWKRGLGRRSGKLEGNGMELKFGKVKKF